MTDTPKIIEHYLAVAAARDAAGLAACFTEDGTVEDEGKTYRGRAEIRAWREALAGAFTYTTTVTGSQPADDGRYRVTVDADGDFPGGHASLTYLFTLRDGLIADLHIGE